MHTGLCFCQSLPEYSVSKVSFKSLDQNPVPNLLTQAMPQCSGPNLPSQALHQYSVPNQMFFVQLDREMQLRSGSRIWSGY